MPLDFIPIPKVWTGERVFIVGGGPSIKSLDWEVLRGQKVLACNAAAFLLPEGIAQYAVFGDKPFLRAFRGELRGYADSGGLLINATGRPVEPENHWMYHVRRLFGTKSWGISKDPEWVSWNRSTGGCAINLAYLLGAREIVLLGFDMRAEGKKHNWHEVYEPHYRTWNGNNPGGLMPKPGLSQYQVHFIYAFKRIAEDLKELKVPCWNTYQYSALVDKGYTPYKPLGELL
jgi:hypothetical protein